MSEPSYEGLLRLFHLLDRDGNNSISSAELQKELGYFGFNEEQRDKFMKQFDLNKDEEITLDEYRIALGIPFTAPYPRITKREASNAALMALFANCDLDRNGKINKHELLEALKECNAPQDQKEELISKLDLDGDGIVTLGEYKVALGMTYEHVEAWQQLFNELDADRSGDITLDEIRVIFDESGMTVLKDVIDEWIKDHDRNGDGKLNYKEFMTFVGRQAEKADDYL